MARYRRSSTRQTLAIIVVLALVALRWWSGRDVADSVDRSDASGALAADAYEVIRVVDGDTLILGENKNKVRLQGVDTPETVKEDTPVEPWGPEATEFTRQFVAASGGVVRVEIDGEARDQYGRFLAFLWHDGRMLNEELVRHGLARAKLGYDYSQAKKDRFKAAERQAKRERRGIWSSP